MFAAYNNYNETVNHLTFRTKDLNTEDSSGMTLLLIYIEKEDSEMAYKIVNRGADVNYRNRFGKSPLLFAIENKVSHEIIDYFIRKGANPHLEDSNGKDVCDHVNMPMYSNLKAFCRCKPDKRVKFELGNFIKDNIGALMHQ